VRRRKRKKQQEPPKTLEQWIEEIYARKWSPIQIRSLNEKELQTHPLLEKRYYWIQGRGVDQRVSFAFLCSDGTSHYLELASLLGPLIWLQPSSVTEGEYDLPFYFLQPEFLEGRDIRIHWAASSMLCWEIRYQEGSALILIEKERHKSLVRELAAQANFQEALGAFLFDQAGTHHKPEPAGQNDPLVLEIPEPVDFMAGRYFLPLVLHRSSPMVQSLIQRVLLSLKGDFFKEERGLWYRGLFRLEEAKQNLGLFYFFPGAEDPSSGAGKSVVQLVKTILRHFRSRLEGSGLKPSGFGGDFCKEPAPTTIVQCYILEIRIYSANRVVPAYILLPVNLLRFLLKRLTPAWKWLEIVDNPLNRLRMLFSLDGEVRRQKLIALLPEHGEKIAPREAESLEDLRQGFITLSDLFSLSTYWESKQLLSNFLYREGWTGAMLPRLFFYIQWESIQGKSRPVRYRLAGFNEERLIDAMPRNMADQWPLEGAMPGVLLSYNEWCRENYLVLKELYAKVTKKELILPFRQLRILKEAFDEYTHRVKIYVQQYLQQNPIEWTPFLEDKQKLQSFFYHYSGEEVFALFQYGKESLKRVGSVIPPAKKDSIIQCIRKNKETIGSAEDLFLHYSEARERLFDWMNSE